MEHSVCSREGAEGPRFTLQLSMPLGTPSFVITIRAVRTARCRPCAGDWPRPKDTKAEMGRTLCGCQGFLFARCRCFLSPRSLPWGAPKMSHRWSWTFQSVYFSVFKNDPHTLY